MTQTLDDASQIIENQSVTTPDAIHQRATELLSQYKDLIATIPYVDRGVFFCEALFVYAAVGPNFQGQLLESGRALGQSTYLFSKFFPQATIQSVEFDRNSPDVPVAEARLSGCDNVKLLFGDAREVLPGFMQAGDVAVIDGPKGFRAVRLALTLLRTGKLKMVFLHDTYKHLPTREFLQRNVPGACFSDDDAFVRDFADLDAPCWQLNNWDKDGGWPPEAWTNVKNKSYSATFACLPYREGVSYSKLIIKAGIANSLTRFRRKILKLTGKIDKY